MIDNGNGIKWKKACYHWSGISNPNRAWWEFWKPMKATIRLTFLYHFCDEQQRLKLGDINLEIVHE